MPDQLDLFGGDLGTVCSTGVESAALSVAPSRLSPTPVVSAIAPLPEVVARAPLHFDVLATPPALNHCLYAFVAQARWHGHTDPSLTRVFIDKAGRGIVDEVEVTRFANELLRGVRSDRPAMTSERWAEAIQVARRLTTKGDLTK